MDDHASDSDRRKVRVRIRVKERVRLTAAASCPLDASCADFVGYGVSSCSYSGQKSSTISACCSIAPDGTPWASFWDACAEDLPKPDPSCPASRKTPGTTTLGYSDFAGRLAQAPAQALVLLPATRACASRRVFQIRLRVPRGTAVRRAIVAVNGTRVRVLRGRRLRAPIDLRGLPRGRFTVTITLELADGRKITTRRLYRTCLAR